VKLKLGIVEQVLDEFICGRGCGQPPELAMCREHLLDTRPGENPCFGFVESPNNVRFGYAKS
jgi:hypothetical protein